MKNVREAQPVFVHYGQGHVTGQHPVARRGIEVGYARHAQQEELARMIKEGVPTPPKKPRQSPPISPSVAPSPRVTSLRKRGEIADDAEHVVFDAKSGQNVKVALSQGYGTSLIDSEKRIRDLHHARVPVSMMLEALQIVCGLCTDTTLAHGELLKHAVHQLLVYTATVEALLKEYRMRHVKKCSPVGALLKKRKDDNTLMEIVHHWFGWAQENGWKKKFQQEQAIRIRENAQRQKHLIDIFLGRTSRSMSITKLRKVVVEWKSLTRENYFQRMFIAHLIRVRENVAQSATAVKNFYLFKEECVRARRGQI
jgi:hypothetical protein